MKPLDTNIPKGHLVVVTGVSGPGKTTLILESPVPGLETAVGKTKLPELMATDVDTALEVCKDMKLVRQRLQVLKDLGYLTLGMRSPACPAARPGDGLWRQREVGGDHVEPGQYYRAVSETLAIGSFRRYSRTLRSRIMVSCFSGSSSTRRFIAAEKVESSCRYSAPSF